MSNKLLSTEKLIGIGMMAIGLLFFFNALHILTINAFDKTGETLNTLFTILIYTIMPLALLLVFTLLVRFLKWAWYIATTPASKRNQDEDDD